MEHLPTAVSSSEITLFGVTLHCHVLDDGQRIIEAEDVSRLFAAMENTEREQAQIEGLEEFARFCRGTDA